MRSFNITNGNSSEFDTHYDSYDHYQTQQMLTEFSYKQERTLGLLNQKCNIMESGIEGIETEIVKLQDTLKTVLETVQMSKLSKFKDQQHQFMQKEMKDKIKKLQATIQKLQNDLLTKEQECIEVIASNQKLARQNLQLAAELDRKADKIRNLIETNKNLKKAKEVEALSKKPSEETSPTFKKLNDYQKLENQLKDLQILLGAEIEEYKHKNMELQKQVSILKNRLQDMNEDSHSKHAQKIYELEFKIRNLQHQNKELEEMYQSEAQKTSNIEFQLHKTITQLKSVAQKQKKQMKSYRHQIEKNLKKIVEDVIADTKEGLNPQHFTCNQNKNLLLCGPNTDEQFQQVKNALKKYIKRIINALTLQNNVLVEQKRLEIESKQNKIKNLSNELQSYKEKLQKQKLGSSNSLTNQNTGKNQSINSQNSNSKEINDFKKSKGNHTQILHLRQNITKIQEKLAKERQIFDEKQANLHEQLLQKSTRQCELSAQLQFSRQTYESKQKDLQELIQRNTKKIQELEAAHQLNNKLHEETLTTFRLQIINKEDELKTNERQCRDIEKKLNELQKKQKGKEDKWNKMYTEMKSKLNSKQKIIDELINKNQGSAIQCKLLKEKNAILEFTLSDMKESLKDQEQKLRKIEEKSRKKETEDLQKYEQSHQINSLSRKVAHFEQIIENLKNQLSLSSEQMKYKEQKLTKTQNQLEILIANHHDLQGKCKNLQNKNQFLEQSVEKCKAQISSQKEEAFTRIKKQYTSNIEKANTEIVNLQKKLDASISKKDTKIESLSQENQKLKNIVKKMEGETLEKEQQLKYAFDVEKFRDKKKYDQMVKQFNQQIGELSNRIQELMKVQNLDGVSSANNQILPTNNEPKIKKMRKTLSVEYVQKGTNTSLQQSTYAPERKVKEEVKLEKEPKQQNLLSSQVKSSIFGSQLFKIDSKVLDDSLNYNDKSTSKGKKEESSQMKNSNLFSNLKFQERVQDEDAFEICDEEQAVNFGQSAVNLQIRELFNTMRTQIQKLFNEQDISMSMIKLLPPALQDDYFEFTAYVKQKIIEIKNNNQISFIEAEPGREDPLQQSFDFPELIQRHKSEQQLQFRRTIEEKDALIMSLMTEKNSQQNTINQLTQEKEQIEEQNQNRFMNQCNIYKKQIKEHKKMLDTLEMKYESFKNVIKNILESYSSHEDMEDDFRDSMTVYARMAKLNEKDRTRINFHIQRFREIKGIQ